MLSFFALTLLFTGCSKDQNDCIRGNESVTTRTFELDTYKAISVNGRFDLIIREGVGHRIEIEAESNLIEHIYAKVINETLIITEEDRRCLNNRRPMRIYATADALEAISLWGMGNVTGDSLIVDHLNLNLAGSGQLDLDIDVNTLDATLSGSGTLELDGTARETDLRLIGSGEMDLLDLPHAVCDIEVGGSGDAYVNVDESLNVQINGSGSVFYLGNPTLREEINGSGEVSRY